MITRDDIIRVTGLSTKGRIRPAPVKIKTRPRKPKKPKK